MATTNIPQTEQLKTNLKPDVCVVGSGIAGLTTAYLLSKGGQSVVVLDRASIGGGETSRTTAHLASVIDDGLQEIESLHGTEALRLHVKSHQAAIDRIEQIVRDEDIDCEFRRLDGYLFGTDDKDSGYLRKEEEAAKKAGITNVVALEHLPLSFPTGPALRFSGQAQFHALKYLSGLVSALIRDGVQIFAHTPVERVEDSNPVRVTTKGGHTVECAAAVIATNSPINNVVAIHSKQAPYRTYAIG